MVIHSAKSLISLKKLRGPPIGITRLKAQAAIVRYEHEHVLQDMNSVSHQQYIQRYYRDTLERYYRDTRV